MSADTPPPDSPPGSAGDGRAWPGRLQLAIMATVLYISLVIFTYGFLSLVLDLDVVDVADAGPLIGPAMVAVCAAAVFVLTFRGSPRGPVARATVAALGVAILGPATGAVLLVLTRGEFLVFPLYFGRFVLGPFAVASAVCAAVVVGAGALVGRRS